MRPEKASAIQLFVPVESILLDVIDVIDVIAATASWMPGCGGSGSSRSRMDAPERAPECQAHSEFT
ncbi:hypothetical protein [Streptomyces pseudovenezuelae]|uniref:hypothetical protein n=1 Tax=Streptomyces pseudovenezuelae TaxID=67350 RepID=UPI0036E6F4A9